MRISVDIDNDTIRDVMALTGEKNKSPAIAKAVIEFVRRTQAREFGRLIREGSFDYPDTAMPRSEQPDPGNPVPPLPGA